MESRNAPSYLSRLDHLRFLAAALVIVYHYCMRNGGDIHTTQPLLALVAEGHTGVGLFMVMSGFIFAVIAYGHQILYRGFLYNRLLRIYPLYLFGLLFSVYLGRESFAFPDVMGALLPFLNLRNPPSINAFDQLWTVAVEFQFYLIFPFLWAFFQRYGARYLAGLIALLILSRALAYGVYGSVQDLAYWTIYGRLDQFLIGMLLGVAWHRYPKCLANPLWLLAACGLVLAAVDGFKHLGGFYGAGYPSHSAIWIVVPTGEALVWGFLALAYVHARLRLPVRLDRALAWLGKISFSLYVMHNLVVFFFTRQLGVLPLRAGHPVFNVVATGLLVVVPATILLSALTYYLIERPFLAWRGRYLRPMPEAGQGQ